MADSKDLDGVPQATTSLGRLLRVCRLTDSKNLKTKKNQGFEDYIKKAARGVGEVVLLTLYSGLALKGH